MRLAVTGASGFVARHLARHARGRHELVPISRSGTGYGRAALARAMRGCDAVAHLGGSGRPGGRGYGNAETTEQVARAAAGARVRRIVYLSGLGVSAKNTSAYFASKLEAERLIRSSGLEYAVLRPSYIVGGSDYLTRSLRSQARRGQVLVPGGAREIQPVSVLDAVRVIERAAQGGRFANRTLDLVGPESVPFEAYVRRFLRSAGLAARIRRVPAAEALRLAVSGRFPYSADDLCILAGGFEGDYGALRRAYGADLTAPHRAQARQPARSPPR